MSNSYKYDLKKSSKEELQKHLDNNLDSLRKKIQLYIADNNIKIFQENDFNKEMNYLFDAIKEEFSNQIKLIEGKINEEKLKKEKLFSRSIPDGIYLIYPAHCQGKVLDISGGSKDNNAVKPSSENVGTENVANVSLQSVAGDMPQKRPDGKAPFARKRIFLIDDDTEEATSIMSELRDEYLVTHFNNGAAAITDILNYMPDIVITDLMAPELDGFSLCKRIKQNININGIPVVIITDKTGDDVEISSLQAGADAFISKPFNIELLKQTVKNLISLRHKLIVNYSGAQQPKEATDLDQYEDPEEKLIKRIVKAV
jgi:CheY-like chemotaxis protein